MSKKRSSRKKKSNQKSIGFFLTVVFLVVIIGLLAFYLLGFVLKNFPVSKLEVVDGSVNSGWTTDCQKIHQPTKDYFCVTGRVKNNTDYTAYETKLRFNIKKRGSSEIVDTRRINYCLPEVPPQGVREFSCIVLSTDRHDEVRDYTATVQVDEAMYKYQAVVYGILDKLLCQKFHICNLW